MEDALLQEYVERLAALGAFRERFAGYRGEPSLPEEDPDLRRLVEALAFFSARTRLVTDAATRARWRRLCAGHLDFLLEPLPAMGLVQARPEPALAGPVSIPSGTSFQLSRGTSFALGPGGQRGYFRTRRALTVLPLSWRREPRFEALPGGTPGSRNLVFALGSRVPLAAGPDTLSFQLQVGQDLRASLALQASIRDHLLEAHAWFDDPCGAPGAASRCSVSFSTRSMPAEDQAPVHPLVPIRTAFHFPEEEAVLLVKLPRRVVPWRTLTLAFGLDARCPLPAEAPESGVFQLFTVAAENLQRDSADPILCDGTREAWPIIPTRQELGRALHSVTRVDAVSGSGRKPLRSALVPGSGPAWELDRHDPAGQGARLLIDHPGAFFAPCTVVVEGLWHQPAFGVTPGAVRVAPHNRQVEGVGWSLGGPLRPARENVLVDDPDRLLRVLALRMNERLDAAELGYLLDALGVVTPGPFGGLPERIRSLDDKGTRRGEDGRERRTWRLELGRGPASGDPGEPTPGRPGSRTGGSWNGSVDDGPRLRFFVEAVQALLDAWLPDAVRLEVCDGGSSEPWRVVP